MAELFTFRPLFPGSSELDQINKVCSVRGSPSSKNWPEGVKLASRHNMNIPRYVKTPLEQLIPQASKAAINLLEQLLKYDPTKRPTANQCLQDPWFNSLPSDVKSPAASSGKNAAKRASVLPPSQQSYNSSISSKQSHNQQQQYSSISSKQSNKHRIKSNRDDNTMLPSIAPAPNKGSSLKRGSYLASSSSAAALSTTGNKRDKYQHQHQRPNPFLAAGANQMQG